ncbi:MAG: flagellar basal-body rod protein FlgG, partial [Desulfosarcina sp.]
HGVRPAATQKMFSQGEFSHTQNQLDMAIEGGGFFQVIQPNGEIGYTRAGTFKLDGEGRVVTSDGFAMEPELTIPSDAVSVSIATDGTVSALLAGDNQPAEIGTIELATFVNPAGLNSIGRNLFIPSAASGDATTGTPGEDNFGTLAQGYLEMSNVSVVDEMVNMIVAQRAYETNSKTIQASDEMLQTATNLRR